MGTDTRLRNAGRAATSARPRLTAEQRAALVSALPRALAALVRVDEPIGPHTTWKIGGPADLWVEVASPRELGAVLRSCDALGVPLRVLGAGSNVLVADEGAAGVVVALGGDLEQVVLERATERSLSLRAGAGARLTAFARRISNEGWSGLEFAVGIPSTVGGALVMNAGAHGREMKDVVTWAEIVEKSGERRRLEPRELGFSYRRTALPPQCVVSRVGIALTRDDPAAIRARVRAHLDYRKRTQPLTEPSCGSVFVNPPDSSAGRLVEEAGLKGRRIGGAEISPLHANFIVNVGGASAADVVALVREARAAVASRTGIELRPEVKPFGDFAGGAPW